VHDRDVEQQHERRHAHRDQGPPFSSHPIPSIVGAKLVRQPCKASELSGYLIRSPDDMPSDVAHTHRVPMIRLLGAAFDEFSDELTRRVLAAGYTDIRPGHGCVFGHIDPDGSRLTDLADRAGM